MKQKMIILTLALVAFTMVSMASTTRHSVAGNGMSFQSAATSQTKIDRKLRRQARIARRQQRMMGHHSLRHNFSRTHSLIKRR